MFNILKFLGGFNIFNGEKLGKLVFYAVLIIVGLTIYHKAFESKNVTRIERQIIEKQIISNCPKDDSVGFRFNIWKLHLGGGI